MLKIYPQAQQQEEIKGISFYSATEGYVAFNSKIGFTSDGGQNFVVRQINGKINYNNYPANDLLLFQSEGIFAFDNMNLLVYGTLGVANAILSSSDNGLTYTLVDYRLDNSLTFGMLKDMQFKGNTGFVIDADHIFRTTDKGQTWSVLRNDPESYFSSLSFVDASNVFISSGNKILHSGNAGNTWQTITLTQPLQAGFFLNSLEGWFSTGGENENAPAIFHTSDAGNNWTRVTNEGLQFIPLHLQFTNSQTGYAYDHNRWDLYKTTDGGRYWEKLILTGFQSRAEHVTGFHLFNNNHLWAGTSDGLFYSNQGGGQSLPHAAFKIDTAGYTATASVKLINYSNPAYVVNWYRNGIHFSTAQQPSYSRGNYPVKDTITLIVSNKVAKDTLTLYQEFNPPVELGSFTPGSGALGHEVILRGKNFKDVLSVSFGGQPALSFSVLSDIEIRATVGEGASGDVKVVTLNGGAASLPGFLFLPPPIFISFSPLSDIAGNTITITGSNFLEVQSVWIGGTRAVSFTVVNSSTILAKIPSGKSGIVKVVTKAGTVELPGFVAKPSFFSFSPDRDTEAGWLKIRGSSLSEVNSIQVGGVAVQSFSIINADSIVALVGKGASGMVTLTAPGGTASLPGFTFLEPPVITSISPVDGPVGSIVTISGLRFDPVTTNNTVFFGAVKAVVKTSSPTSLTVEVPAGASFQPLSVQARGLTAWSSQPFRVTYTGGAYPAPNSFIRQAIGAGEISFVAQYLAYDMDTDGKPDLALITSGANGGGLAFFRNNSTSTQFNFAAPILKLLGEVNAMTAADINGDGKPDMAILMGDGRMLLFPNNSTPGNINFGEPVIYNNISAANRIFINDIDNDGKPDIITALNGKLIVLRNISEPGMMTFDMPQVLPYTDKYYLADMDLDGDLDLLASDENNQGNLYLNESTPGKIEFRKGASIPIFAHIQSCDINRDGKIDIIGVYDNKILIMLNSSTTANPSFSAPLEIETSTEITTIALGDLDGDGKTDICITNRNSHLTSFHNRSQGNQLAFSGGVILQPGADLYRDSFGIGINDLNGDGKPDIFIRGEDEKQLLIYLNDCSPRPYIGSFDPANAVAGTLVTIKGSHFTGITKVSFGGADATSFNIISDSLLTAVVSPEASTGDVAVTNAHGIDNRPGFIYGIVPGINQINPAQAPAGAVVTITGTGFGNNKNDNLVLFGGAKAEVLSASSTQLSVVVPTGAAPGPVTVTANRLTGSSSQHFIVTFPGDTSKLRETSFEKGNYLYSKFTSIADIDNDGKQDLVLIAESGNLQVARNTGVPGHIEFASPVAIQGNAGIASATGDLDGDGKMDVVVLNQNLQSFSYYRNTSTVTAISFASSGMVSFIAQSAPNNHIRVHDIDGDGRPDVMVTNSATHSLYYFKNLSDNSGIKFAPLFVLRMANPKDVRIADFNNDGKPEILVGSAESGGVFYYAYVYNHIPGSSVTAFEALRIDRGYNRNFATADLNGDGKLDLISSTELSNLVLYRNESDLQSVSFDPGTMKHLSNVVYSVSAGDLNGDGRPDIVAGLQNYLVFLKNQSNLETLQFDTTYQEYYSFGQASVLHADLDGDGVLDLAVASSNTVTPLRNGLADITLMHICKSRDTVLSAGIEGSNYQWQWDIGNGFENMQYGTAISGINEASLRLKQVPVEWNNYLVRCMVDGKPGRSFRLLVNGIVVTPAVSISLPTDNICSGATIGANAVVTHGGDNPSFNWTLNGRDLGPGPGMITAGPLTADATIRVVLTSSEACVTNAKAENEVIVKVKQPSSPVVIITPSKEKICKGETVTYTATVGQGLTPVSYQWKKNGQNAGLNQSTYSDNAIRSDDEISVNVLVHPVCGGGSEAFAVAGKIEVKDPLEPSATIRYSTPDAVVRVYNASVVVTNASRVHSYQWYDSTRQHGWQPLPGANSITFAYTPLTSGDKLKCIVNLTPNCGDVKVDIETEAIGFQLLEQVRLSPNPVKGILYIDEINPNDEWKKLEIINLSTGAKVMEMDPSGKRALSLSVAHLVPGHYSVVLRGQLRPAVHIRFLKL
ncbi:FG-GAP-like repeat-containing protein [Pseudobacter ginsenosidimutans]|uniref:FG-GAP-like repeat-containing protein n=1 Tax=Pseudobacter ginsenosidimutans TaxID=661488 RepID=UPI0013157022|nr:FG-GAP-like repeat-containing protein [Pseudobacter ginsenosidimutans]